MQSGEEIYTDDMARVKVRFYWDWRAESTGSNAVWARVIQPWAGKGWGVQFTPRVGTEVAVAFVDGDPDRPIVIGGLYNGAQAPIYLSADKTKTRPPHPLQPVRQHLAVQRAHLRRQGGQRTDLHACRKGHVHRDREQPDADGGQLPHRDGEAERDGRHPEQPDHHRDAEPVLTVSNGNSTFDVGTGDHTVTIDKGNQSVTISKGNSTFEVSTGNHTETIDKGNYTININAGQMSITAKQGISLTVGQSSISLTPSGITVAAAQIRYTRKRRPRLTEAACSR